MSITMVSPATPRQLEVLAFIRMHMLERGAPPTIRDIMRHFDWTSPNGTMGHIKALIRKGLLQQSAVYKRGGFVPVVPPGCCPCCGRPMEEL